MTARLAFLIAGITAIAVGIVDMRWTEMNLEHQMHVLECQKPALKRQLWDCQAEIGWKTTSETILKNIDKKAIKMGFPSEVGQEEEDDTGRLGVLDGD